MTIDAITDFEATTDPGVRQSSDLPPTPVASPAVQTPEPEPEPEPDGDDNAESRESNGRFRGRHRARSQQASAEDVPRIRELTAKLRTAEAERDALKQARTAPIEPVTQPVTPRPDASQPPKAQFDKPKPTLDDMVAAGHEDAYEALIEARADWRDEKREWEQRHTESSRAEQQEQARLTQQIAAHSARVTAFSESHPDFNAVLDAIPKDEKLTPIMERAIFEHDKGPEMVYHLATHPELRDEFFLLTLDKTLTPEAVASMQRRLLQRMQVVSTGSTAPPDRFIAPRPPNPVRTGPLKLGDEPPSDTESLDEHLARETKRRR